jgi:imidazole glycerol-phosphate synthase subunit HisF
MIPRVMPVMVIHAAKCFHTINFKPDQYLGDPVSIARLYGEMDADELIVFDKSNRDSIYENKKLKIICQEVYIPVAYGGNLKTLEDVDFAMKQGIEKVVLQISDVSSNNLIQKVANKYGNQSVVACVNYSSVNNSSSDHEAMVNQNEISDAINLALELGSGEILIQDVGRSGTRTGFDFKLIALAFKSTPIPVIYSGGAKGTSCLEEVILAGASAVAASTIFSLSSRTNTPLVSYLDSNNKKTIENLTS